MIRLCIALLLTAFAASAARAEIDIQEVTSPGGIRAWLVEEHSIPFVALEIRFKGGASLDPEGRRGAINLMAGLLEEGTGDMDARAFAREAEALAASFDYDAYDDSIAISAKMLTENRDQAAALLRKSIVAPRFDQVALDRVRAQVLTGIRSDMKDPNEIASATFNQMAFGNHPYGSAHEGTVDSVTALTRDDIVAVHQGTMARDRLFVSAVGDITAEELGGLLDMLLGDLPETGFALPETADFALEGGISLVSYDTPQSVALFGHAGMVRDDPDFFAAYVLNVILGGSSFENRLMEEVRVKRGLTYGVGTYLVPKDYAAMVLGQVASANDRIAQAIEVIRSEWARIVRDGVTEEELTRAKTFLTGAYPLRFDGNGPIANILVGMQMEALPKEYVITRNDQVRAVTLADVNRVARELLQPEGLHFTVVGQPVGLDEAIPVQSP